MVNDLIYKRGQCFVNGTRTPINSNELVECMLGDKNMICIEDLVHEIVTGGENFEYCCQFLCPFRLNNPPGGWKRTSKSAAAGGEYGNRGDRINELLSKIV
jgi:60S ribosomal protein uL30